tara:strand:- start:415 stop:945 length:531 start_codon:yes stop_codon:yes gene_type:complete
MAEDLGSTNITDLINDDDTDMNDDMVNKILNELENEEPEDNNDLNLMEENSFHNDLNNTFSTNQKNPILDFRDPDFNNHNNINLESENTVNKINSIINDSNGLEISSIATIINNFKLPLIVFILCIVFNNPLIMETISNILSNIIKNNNISSYISLTLRTIIISLILFLINYFDLL